MYVGQPQSSTFDTYPSYADLADPAPLPRPFNVDTYSAGPLAAHTFAAQAHLQVATRTWRRLGAALGALGAAAGYTGGIIALALHKRSQVAQGNMADSVTQAQDQYNQCYNGAGTWGDIDAACQRTLSVALPGVTCAWNKLWYMVDRVPQACVTGLARVDDAARYHDQREAALNWLGLLVALPVAAAVGGALGGLLGHCGRQALGVCAGSRLGAARGLSAAALDNDA